ncbi:hypothetical protein GXW82_25475 [Streptacidiphilus sp. 4-A2]|nr:hypothetical protein [Streptacidiphilus sp. 4-A2]
MKGKVAQAMLTAWVKAGRPLEEEPYSAGIFAEVVEQARQAGEISEHVDCAQVGLLIRDAYLGALYRWSRGGTRLASELNTITRIILEGISTGPPAPRPSAPHQAARSPAFPDVPPGGRGVDSGPEKRVPNRR